MAGGGRGTPGYPGLRLGFGTPLHPAVLPTGTLSPKKGTPKPGGTISKKEGAGSKAHTERAGEREPAEPGRQDGARFGGAGGWVLRCGSRCRLRRRRAL